VRPSLLGTAALGLAVALTTLLACGDDATADGPATDAGSDRRLAQPFRPPASCPVVIESPELLGSPHVPEGTAISYNSNPPCSGPHYPVWANFKEYSAPLDEGYLVHSLEHGAVALLYKCDPAAADCAPTIDALRKIRDAVPTDPSCSSDIRVRIIIAPAPRLEAPVAAAAWGFTYKADCVDVPTLTQFVKDNYAMSPENICAAGRTF
jgi:hypothetical protein